MGDCRKVIKTVRIPEIYCALSLFLHNDIDEEFVLNELHKIGICNATVRKPKCEPSICVDIAVVRYEHFWDLDSALGRMFLQIDSCLDNIRNFAITYSGEIYIDIAFCHYGTYPSLIFCGDNMKKIRYLEANISIDPYDYKND